MRKTTSKHYIHMVPPEATCCGRVIWNWVAHTTMAPVGRRGDSGGPWWLFICENGPPRNDRSLRKTTANSKATAADAWAAGRGGRARAVLPLLRN